ncbi:MAG: hypothetical protein Q9162_000588 [Coniocarpon cinnabarinum]
MTEWLLTRTAGTGWMNTEFRTYNFDPKSGQNASLVETEDSRLRRRGTEKPLSEAEQRNLARTTGKLVGYLQGHLRLPGHILAGQCNDRKYVAPSWPVRRWNQVRPGRFVARMPRPADLPTVVARHPSMLLSLLFRLLQSGLSVSASVVVGGRETTDSARQPLARFVTA